MTTTYESFKIFIASPGDVKQEQEIAISVIQRVSSTCKESLGIELEPVTWNDFVPKAPKLPEERIQDVLNSEIPKCQAFILVLGKRYGSTETGHRVSNTEREVNIALELLKRKKKLMFLSYFKQLPSGDDKGGQQQSVEAFRKSLQEQGIWYKDFSKPNDLGEILTHDLYRTVLRFRLSTNKHVSLRKFWVFGKPDRPTFPTLAIIYPSMNRSFMGPVDDTDVWLNRLEPNVVFEDVKALQKIEKTLRLIGFRDFRIFNSSSIPSDIQFMNRFWICLPRNNRGLEQAKRYIALSRFEMVRKQERAKSYIRWRCSPKAKKWKIVKSPLALYLREQRSRMDLKGEWRHEMDHIVAKDYAILAHFRDEVTDVAMTDGCLHDYFLAGLRGLGTWGAAWFIDRKYRSFDKIEDDLNTQFLLEVEYRDGRIYDVRDVSDRPQEYFDAEQRVKTVRSNITNYVPH